MVESIDGGCNVVSLAHINPGSNIPIMVVKKMATASMPRFVRGLVKAMRKYYN